MQKEQSLRKKYNDCNLPKLSLCQLTQQIRNLRTGTTIFTHNPTHITAKIIREGLDSFWNHSVTVFWINGELYIVEAMTHQTVQPILFEKWIANRQDETFGVVEREIEDRKITCYFGRRYDLWSVVVCFFVYRYTGIWLGRVDDKAADKVFCLELTALICGVERYFDAVPDRLVPEKK